MILQRAGKNFPPFFSGRLPVEDFLLIALVLVVSAAEAFDIEIVVLLFVLGEGDDLYIRVLFLFPVEEQIPVQQRNQAEEQHDEEDQQTLRKQLGFGVLLNRRRGTRTDGRKIYTSD